MNAATCPACQDIAFWSAHENLMDLGHTSEYADAHAEADSIYNLEEMKCEHGA